MEGQEALKKSSSGSAGRETKEKEQAESPEENVEAKGMQSEHEGDKSREEREEEEELLGEAEFREAVDGRVQAALESELREMKAAAASLMELAWKAAHEGKDSKAKKRSSPGSPSPPPSSHTSDSEEEESEPPSERRARRRKERSEKKEPEREVGHARRRKCMTDELSASRASKLGLKELGMARVAWRRVATEHNISGKGQAPLLSLAFDGAVKQVHSQAIAGSPRAGPEEAWAEMAKACLNAAHMRAYAEVAMSPRYGSKKHTLVECSMEIKSAAMMLGYALPEQKLLGQLARGPPPALRRLAASMSGLHAGVAAQAAEASKLTCSQRGAVKQVEELRRSSEMDLCRSGKIMASGALEGRIQGACSVCSARVRFKRAHWGCVRRHKGKEAAKAKKEAKREQRGP